MTTERQPTDRPLPGHAITITMVAASTAHGLRCPVCGATEVNPALPDTILIRGFKVDGYSQCLVCAGFYDPLDLSDFSQDRGDARKGWFR